MVHNIKFPNLSFLGLVLKLIHFLLSFGDAEDGTQVLTSARQILYHCVPP
jgi:hypothetical protein